MRSVRLQDKSSSASALKIQALQFLGLALHGASSLEWQHQIGRLAPPIFSAVGDRYYKVSAEAIRVCEELVHAIRPSPPAPLQPALQVRRLQQAGCAARASLLSGPWQRAFQEA